MRRTSGLILLLVIMLNHAVLACDAMVIHLPEHDHSYTSVSHCNSTSANTEVQQGVTDTEESHSHTQHAHVSCHIAYQNLHHVTAVNCTAVAPPTPGANCIHYQPPVPPPNA